MKLATFQYNGRRCYGVVTHQGIIELSEPLTSQYPDLKQLLAGGEVAKKQVEHYLSHRTTVCHTAPLTTDAVHFLPVIDNPGKIICIGLNYEAHRLETGRKDTEQPTLFMRCATSQTGHNTSLLCPRESIQLDFEGEIALIIGKAGRRITKQQAHQHIAGYACYNDASVRDWQFHTSQWTAGKNFDATGAFGPWMITPDEASPVMTLTTRLNGQLVQQATTQQLKWRFDELLEYISTFTTLQTGDVIVTGTPGGIGARRSPPLFMRAGDVVEVAVDCIGVLRNVVQSG